MSDIRFNQWLHQSGTGGVTQLSSGHVGIGTTNPLIPVHSGNNAVLNVGVVTANNIYAGTLNGTLALSDISGITGSFTSDLTVNGTNLDISDKIRHIGDTNTAIRFPAADTISFETAGTERLRITDDGRIGINDPSPNDYELDILKRSSAIDAQMRLYNNATGSSNDTIMRYQIGGTTANNYIYFGDGDDSNAGQIRYSHNSNFLSIHTNAAERLRIGDSGQIGLSGANYGTSGQVLTSQGSGSAVQWSTVSSDFVKISSTTMSGEAAQFELDFDTSTYSYFKIYLTGLNLSYDANLYVRFKVGGTVQTNNAYYGGTVKRYWQGFDTNVYGGQNQNYGYLTHNVGGNDGTYERYSAIFDINCGEAGRGMPFLRHDSFYKDASANHANTMGIVGYQNWNQINGIRFYASSGNINHGKFDLYGIK